MTAVTALSAETASGPAPDGEPRVLVAGGRLTIHHVADVHTLLVAALDAASPTLTLDLGEVEEADTAGLQLLLWVVREARDREVRLAVATSPAVVAVLAAAGLDETSLATGGDR